MLQQMKCELLWVYCTMIRGFYYKTGKFRALTAQSQLSDLTPGHFGLQACDVLVFGPQVCAGRDGTHMLPGTHEGNRVKVNPDRHVASVLSPLALHHIAGVKHILYPPLSLSPLLAEEAHCNEGLIREIFLTILQPSDNNSSVMHMVTYIITSTEYN